MLQLKTTNFCAILEILREDYSNDLAVCLTEYITYHYPYYDEEYNGNSFFTILLNFKEYCLKYKKELEEELEDNRHCQYWEYTFDIYKRYVNALIDFDEENFYLHRFNCFKSIYFNKSQQIDKIIARLSYDVNKYKNPSRYFRSWDRDRFERKKSLVINNFELAKKIKKRFKEASNRYKGK